MALLLRPHTSHICQPLDLACFAFVKGKYRQQIADLARFDDAAPVKKIRFVQFYEQARNSGLNKAHILAGWSVSGIYPWQPSKVLESHQVIQPPKTPPTRRSHGLIPSQSTQNVQITTPCNAKQLQLQANIILRQKCDSRTVRLLFAKTSKAFASLQFKTVEQGLQLANQAKIIEEHHVKKRKKIAIDTNKQFAGIEQIIAAQTKVAAQQEEWNGVNRAKGARQQADMVEQAGMEACMIEFHVSDLAVAL